MQGSKAEHEVVLIILVHLLKKENKELMTKVNLCQTRLSHVSESYTPQPYQNAQLSLNMKVLLIWSKNIIE